MEEVLEEGRVLLNEPRRTRGGISKMHSGEGMTIDGSNLVTSHVLLPKTIYRRTGTRKRKPMHTTSSPKGQPSMDRLSTNPL